MGNYESGLSNLSYTAKDFNSIYSELLDLGDRISPKWKPSQSNESDPGVLLLKLDAIIADKNNYNIDKNILELFPSSVTQYPNAREIFEQCGYVMPYYRAAEVVVSLNVDKNPDNIFEETTQLYQLSDFTQLCDADKTVIYTITDPQPFLTSDGELYQYTAMQGSIQQHKINNASKILYSDLDYNNRLYFKDINVAENAIFISEYGKLYEKGAWKKVDNLLTQPSNTLCYKFGLSRDGGKCYIEFPTDIATLIPNGIEIKYLRTDGYNGNIGEKTLSRFFDDQIKVKVSNEAETRASIGARTNSGNSTAELTDDHVYIRNLKPSVNGRDPESISEARKNYERVKTTFDTLVSLRDYNNFVLTSDQVSNGFVCDRSNDIQATTKIITTDGKLEKIHNQVRIDTSTAAKPPELSPFDLKIYALKSMYPAETPGALDITFQVASRAYIDNLIEDMEDVKCVQHNFKNLNSGEPIYIQLRFPIHAKIIPYNRLELIQQLEIEKAVEKALCEALNANEVVFGEELDYDFIYDTILNSDPRIKSLILDDLTYTPYAICLDSSGNEYAVRLDAYPTSNTFTADDIAKARLMNTVKAKAILAGVTPLFDSLDYDFSYNIFQTSGTIVQAGRVTTNSEIHAEVKGNIAKIKLAPNESLYFTTPNLITDELFGGNCRYAYTGSAVNENATHKLVDTESITFFWKDSDSSNYSYKTFKKIHEDIFYISPNFKLNPVYINFTLSEDSGKLNDEQDALVKKSAQLLDGSKSIAIKSQNTVKLDNKYKIYWITKHIETDPSTNAQSYVLFEKDSTEYTLTSGEYLFYTDSSDKIFALFGTGTKLNREEDWKAKVSCTAKTYEEIMFGTNRFLSEEGLWVNITGDNSITATEMQFYYIGDEATVELAFSEEPPTSVIINNSGITDILKLANISYTPNMGSKVTLPSIDDGNWSGYSILNLNCGPNQEQQLIEGSVANGADTVISRYQKIEVTGELISNDANSKFEDILDYKIDAPNFIQSTYRLETEGGTDIDITAYDALGARYNNAFYYYNKAEPATDDSITISDDIVSITVSPDSDKSWTKEISINLPQLVTGLNYVLPILTDTDYDSLSVSLGSQRLSPFNLTSAEVDADEEAKAGYKFYSIASSSLSQQLTILITAQTTDKSILRILPPLPYTNQDDLNIQSSQLQDYDLINVIKALDVDHKFNYTHTVDTSNMIENPWLGSSYLDRNHPYNPYTLCKWDYKNSTLKITNKVK